MQQCGDSGKARLAWLDYAKGIGIFLVVLGHANRSIGRTPELTWSEPLMALDAAIYSFHMPLFFVLAGYAAHIAGTKDSRSFARGLWWGVVMPYLVWSVVWIGLKAALPASANVPVGLDAIPRLLWQPVEHFWFLYHLFVARLGWYAVERAGGERASFLVLIAAAFLSLAAPAAGLVGTTVAGLLESLVYTGLGLVILPRLLDGRGLSSIAAVSGCAMAWIAVVAFTGAAGPVAGAAAAVTGTGAVIAGARLLPQAVTPVTASLALLGEASLVIYVLHLIFAAAVRVALAKAGLLTPGALITLGTLAGLIGPLAVHLAVQKANRMTNRPFSQWLGLGRLIDLRPMRP